MSQSTQVPGTTGKSQKITLRREGNRWAVNFPCECMDLSFPLHHVALIFATNHTCPPPWAPIPARRKRLTRTVR